MLYARLGDLETELMEISAIADDSVKFERIVVWCATHPDESPSPCISSWARATSARRNPLKLNRHRFCRRTARPFTMALFDFCSGRRFDGGSLRCAGAEESQSKQPATALGLAANGYRYQVLTLSQTWRHPHRFGGVLGR